jgi:hypothetical protein
LADGYLRRGQTAKEAGRLYRRIAEEMKRCASVIQRFRIIKFEEVLYRPFEIAQEIFTFVGAHPTELETLRLKSKKVINSAGQHDVVYGNEHRKYWFSRDTITQIIDPNIDQKQSSRLSDQAIDEFNREARAALQFFGYEAY